MVSASAHNLSSKQKVVCSERSVLSRIKSPESAHQALGIHPLVAKLAHNQSLAVRGRIMHCVVYSWSASLGLKVCRNYVSPLHSKRVYRSSVVGSRPKALPAQCKRCDSSLPSGGWDPWYMLIPGVLFYSIYLLSETRFQLQILFRFRN